MQSGIDVNFAVMCGRSGCKMAWRGGLAGRGRMKNVAQREYSEKTRRSFAALRTTLNNSVILRGEGPPRSIRPADLPHLAVDLGERTGSEVYYEYYGGVFPPCQARAFNRNNPRYFFSTALDSSLPGEKRTRSLSGTVIFSLRLRGLTP